MMVMMPAVFRWWWRRIEGVLHFFPTAGTYKIATQLKFFAERVGKIC